MAQMLTLAALAANPDCLHMIDVRDAADFSSAHVTGAVHIPHIPLAELEDCTGEMPVGKTPVTICGKGGGRSAEGADILKKLGHPDALWLEGGTKGWLARNT